MRLPPGLAVKSTAPDRSAWPRMMPATPRSRSRRTPSRSDTPPATRMSASVERTRRPSELRVRLGAAVRQDEAADAAGDELVGERLERRRRRGPSPGERGEPLRPRVEPDRQPVAGDAEAVGEERRVVDDVHRQDDARRPGREGEPDLVGALEPAGELDRDRDPRRDRADDVEVRRAAALARRRSRRRGRPGRRARRTARRSGRAGPSARRRRPRRRARTRPASGRPRRRSRG